MSRRVAPERPHAPFGRTRAWLVASAAVAWLAVLVPPLSTLARHAEYAAALQFSILAVVVPALVTLAAPWSLIGLAARAGPEPSGASPAIFDRVAGVRMRHRELVRALGFVVLDLLAVLLWRSPPAVRAVAGHGWLAPVEAVTLLVLGVGLWLELVDSPPLAPRSGPLRRGVLAAVAMWVFWIDAYVIAMSKADWYANFHHVAGRGFSAAADQQISAAVLWAVAGATFVPFIFWIVFRWLHSEEDPDAELYRLTKTEARRAPATPSAPGSPGGPPAP